MEWVFNNVEPIYLQIVEKIELGIISGTYPPGSQLPTVRQLADQIGVNPNTVQKAMVQLEQNGYVYSQGTNGRFIQKDDALQNRLKGHYARKYTGEFIAKINTLGVTKEEVLEFIEDNNKEALQ